MSSVRIVKDVLRRFIPKQALVSYHRMRASLVAFRFGYPARQMTMIGVTGTNGKSTVVSLIGQLLAGLGEPIGWVSTASIRIRDKEDLNRTKLTTADPGLLQLLLRRMVRAGCKYAIVEASSEGLFQGRLNGIQFSVGVFTNLTPEHIESHGSFEAYTQAKERLFWGMGRSVGIPGRPKISVVNLDDPSAERFARFPVDRVIGCSLKNDTVLTSIKGQATWRSAQVISVGSTGSRFKLDGIEFKLPLPGAFNVMNALEAIAVVEAFGFPLNEIARALAVVEPIPGRLELIETQAPFKVLVDYAPEPASMAALYETLPLFNAKRIIHVFGSCGGVRDHARRPVLGQWVAERANIAIVTNEDPYDEPPAKIIKEIIVGTRLANPAKAVIEEIVDRRAAIHRALILAQAGDLVVITGKASEQWIVGPHGQKTPWDDRKVVQEELKLLGVDNFKK